MCSSDLGVHYTWAIAVVMITWSLAAGYFPASYRGWSRQEYWIVGAAASLLLFISVLLHELCHSIVAQARGLTVRSITLFIFGGVSNIVHESENPRDEFLIAVVGPVSSLALAGLFWLGGRLVPTTGSLGALLSYLATVNLMLAAFNILPGFPLDGGRVLRAILWGTTHSMVRGTRIASTVGQALAFLFIGYGIWLTFIDRDLISGVWIGFIGWFLNSAAEAARRQIEMQERFRGILVGSVMSPNPPVVSPALPVRELVDEYIVRRGLRALPVAQDGRIVGLVTLTDVKQMPESEWSRNSVGAIMTRPPLRTIEPDASVTRALERLVEDDLNQLLVVDKDGSLLGTLSRGDVMRFLQLRGELGLRR